MRSGVAGGAADPRAESDLNALVGAIGRTGYDLDGISIAEAIWLAVFMPHHAEDAVSQDTVDLQGDDWRSDEPGRSADRSGGASAGVFDRSAADSAGIPASWATVSTGGSLPRAMEVARALRPLKRPWLRGRRTCLDLAATVDAYARFGTLLPQFCAAPERWFEAVVVVDGSASMAIWAPTADVFVRLLEQSGVFRTIRRWTLAADALGHALYSPLGRRASPGEFHTPDRRRLIFVFSDFTAELWYSSSLWRTVRGWARSTPTVLVDPLPERLWRRTGLGAHPAARARALVPGGSNSALVLAGARPSSDAARTALPITTLAPLPIEQWARALMCPGIVQMKTLLISETGGRPETGASRLRAGLSAQDLAEDFLLTAPDNAIRIAVLCSGLDRFTFPLLCLLREELVSEATVADIAEALLSGLFDIEDVQAGPVAFRMHEDAAARLRTRLSTREWRRAREILSRRVGDVGRASPHMPTLIEDSQGTSRVARGAQSYADAPATLRDTIRVVSHEAPAKGSGEVQSLRAVDRVRVADLPASVVIPPLEHSAPLFFVSHAHMHQTSISGHGPDGNEPYFTFFTDLSLNVNQLVYRPPAADPGFIDRGMGSGVNWEHEVLSAVSTCQVFVALLSEPYIQREWCGREWAAFSRRRTWHVEQRHAVDTTPCIMPVVWAPIGKRLSPQAVAARQLFIPRGPEAGDIAKRYASHGIFGLLRADSEAYRTTVWLLAKEIQRLAFEYWVEPMVVPRAEELRNVFRDEDL